MGEDVYPQSKGNTKLSPRGNHVNISDTNSEVLPHKYNLAACDYTSSTIHHLVHAYRHVGTPRQERKERQALLLLVFFQSQTVNFVKYDFEQLSWISKSPKILPCESQIFEFNILR